MEESRNYRPDGLWAALIDTAMTLERSPSIDEEVWDDISEQLRRLARRFDILPGQRERDIGRLLHSIADLELDHRDDDDGDDEGGEYVEDRPL
jgi:hypothetical protein